MRNLVSKLPTVARVGLGLVFFVFGLNGFLHFLPQPPPEGGALQFFTGMQAGGWFIPLLKGTEVAMGALLLSNRFVPLALAVLAPIVVNIVGFHAFLAPAGLPIALVVLALEAYVAWTYRAAFAPMLRAQVAPTPARTPARAAPAAVPSRA